MKKLIAILLTMIMALSLCACAAPAPAPAAQPAAEPDPNNLASSEASWGAAEPAAEPAAEAEPGITDESWLYIQNNGKLVVGLDATFAPMGFTDESGEIVGFDIDLAKAVCEQLGVEAVFQPIDWAAKEQELNGKKIDCIWNGMSATPERAESMSLSRNYLNNAISIMCNEGVSVTDIAQLKDLKIGTQAGSYGLEALQAHELYDTFKDNISEYEDYNQCVMDLDTGRLDVVVGDAVYVQYINGQRAAQGKSTYAVSDVNFGDDLYAIGFRKEDLELTNKVNDAIQTLIENGKAAEISNKWFGSDLIIK